MNNDELEKLLSELKQPGPSEVSVNIYDYIGKHRPYVFNKIGRFIKIFEDFFHETTLTIHYLNFVPKNDWSKHKAIQFLLYPESLKTLHRAFEDVLDGYYDEAMMLNRSVYETFLRIVFLSCYPNEWEAIFYKRPDRMKFDVTSLTQDHLKVDWKSLYKIMSLISHSKVGKILKKLIKISQRQEKVIVELEYSPDDTSLFMAVNILTFNLCILFHSLTAIFSEDFNRHPELQKRSGRLFEIDKALLGMIEANPKVKFSSRARDIRKIGDIIKTADAGGDWRHVAAQTY